MGDGDFAAQSIGFCVELVAIIGRNPFRASRSDKMQMQPPSQDGHGRDQAICLYLENTDLATCRGLHDRRDSQT
jgi:hypothetical protein